MTQLIGRDEAVESIAEMLVTPSVRLVTLTGVGGSGKTRLALEVARRLVDRFPDGVWLAELSRISEPALVAREVAMVLGLQEGPGQPLLETLADWLQARILLLVLDNCEHLVDACASLVESLLQRAPHLQALTTSRESLRIEAEWVYPVLPLSVPDPSQGLALQELHEYDGVRLFLERARAAQPGFALVDRNAAAIATICFRLDGIPLAIELAAARTKILAVDEIASRLENVFGVLGAGLRTAPTRHQTLKATLDWSYDLLSEPERALFRRLAVFPGGFDLEAAEAMAGGTHAEELPPFPTATALDRLIALVDKSLILCREQGGRARYRLLEPVRQYAMAHLKASGELDQVRCRHLEYYLTLAETAEPHLLRAEQAAWCDRLDAELANIRAALQWSREHPDHQEAGLRLAGALWRFWDARGHLSEGRGWLSNLLQDHRDRGVTRGLAKAYFAAGWLAASQEDNDVAAELAAKSVALWRVLDDRSGLAWALWLAGLVQRRRDTTLGLSLAAQAESLAGDTGDDALQRWAIWLSGDLHRRQGDLEHAIAFFGRVLTLSTGAGDQEGAAFARRSLAQVGVVQGKYREALGQLRECLVIRKNLKDHWHMADSLEGMAWVAIIQGEMARAARLYGAADALREMTGATLLSDRHLRREQYLDAARHALGRERFSDAWAEGRHMLLGEAVEYALGALPERDLVPTGHRPAAPDARSLTPRELQVARLLTRGLTNHQIARELTITEGTAGVHVVHILNKLGFNSRWQVSDWAIQHGLIDPEPGD